MIVLILVSSIAMEQLSYFAVLNQPKRTVSCISYDSAFRQMPNQAWTFTLNIHKR
jgi:hypothetical protein